MGPVVHCGRVSVCVWVSEHREPWLGPREELRGQAGGAWAVQGELPLGSLGGFSLGDRLNRPKLAGLPGSLVTWGRGRPRES